MQLFPKFVNLFPGLMGDTDDSIRINESVKFVVGFHPALNFIIEIGVFLKELLSISRTNISNNVTCVRMNFLISNQMVILLKSS